jgi:hypothetical protein
LSPEWRGGAYEVSEDSKANRSVLRWGLEMANEKSAASLIEFWARMLEKKSPGVEFSVRSEGRLAGSNRDGSFVIERAGSRVAGVEGLAAEEVPGPGALLNPGGK